MNDVQADCTGVEKDYQVGELRVWRGWHIDSLGRLTGIQHQAVWRPDGTKAQCLRPLSFQFDIYAAITGRSLYPSTVSTSASAKPHAAPHPQCTCGVYCYYDAREPIDRYGVKDDTPDVVFGIAEVWGRVLVGEKGLRAEHARPVALVMPGGLRWTWRGPRRKNPTHPERMPRVLRNYPDIRVYRSARKALAEMPLWAPTFDTSDPLFWERSAS